MSTSPLISSRQSASFSSGVVEVLDDEELFVWRDPGIQVLPDHLLTIDLGHGILLWLIQPGNHLRGRVGLEGRAGPVSRSTLRLAIAAPPPFNKVRRE